MRLKMKKLCIWLLLAACSLAFSHQLSAATTQPESLRIVYIGAINGYLNLCG